MISNAGAEEIRSLKVSCSRCGHSWLKREGVERDICPVCGSPYIEDEQRNVDRKS
jgi:rRNA maturation endonuclease Nob1